MNIVNHKKIQILLLLFLSVFAAQSASAVIGAESLRASFEIIKTILASTVTGSKKVAKPVGSFAKKSALWSWAQVNTFAGYVNKKRLQKKESLFPSNQHKIDQISSTTSDPVSFPEVPRVSVVSDLPQKEPNHLFQSQNNSWLSAGIVSGKGLIKRACGDLSSFYEIAKIHPRKTIFGVALAAYVGYQGLYVAAVRGPITAKYIAEQASTKPRWYISSLIHSSEETKVRESYNYAKKLLGELSKMLSQYTNCDDLKEKIQNVGAMLNGAKAIECLNNIGGTAPIGLSYLWLRPQRTLWIDLYYCLPEQQILLFDPSNKLISSIQKLNAEINKIPASNQNFQKVDLDPELKKHLTYVVDVAVNFYNDRKLRMNAWGLA